ncbi:MAG: DUF5522 domain-containing protein [Saprospiraceae bacterium]|nr:DUF5522 domain-containing protein [Saprospiraceae bacterium]
MIIRQETLSENIDYYIDNGQYVFTESYLKKRGFCCKCGCRHCPYSLELTNAQPLKVDLKTKK